MTINNAGYYNSDKNDVKGDPANDPNVATHTSERNKINFTDTSNLNLQQKLLINRTLPIITMAIDPQITDSVVTCERTPHVFTTPNTKGVITYAALGSAHILRN